MRDMSRDSHVTHSHRKYKPFLRKLPQYVNQLFIVKVAQNQFSQAVCEASLQGIELLAPAFDGHNLRVLPCCCEQTAFQHVRHAGKGQGIRLEWELGCPCRLGDPHDADRARQQVYFDIALRYACIILGCDRINISSKVLST